MDSFFFVCVCHFSFAFLLIYRLLFPCAFALPIPPLQIIILSLFFPLSSLFLPHSARSLSLLPFSLYPLLCCTPMHSSVHWRTKRMQSEETRETLETDIFFFVCVCIRGVLVRHVCWIRQYFSYFCVCVLVLFFSRYGRVSCCCCCCRLDLIPLPSRVHMKACTSARQLYTTTARYDLSII